MRPLALLAVLLVMMAGHMWGQNLPAMPCSAVSPVAPSLYALQTGPCQQIIISFAVDSTIILPTPPPSFVGPMILYVVNPTPMDVRIKWSGADYPRPYKRSAANSIQRYDFVYSKHAAAWTAIVTKDHPR